MNKKIDDLICELERKQDELEKEYTEKINKELSGKCFLYDEECVTECISNNNEYKNGDIIKIKDYYFYDGHEIVIRNEIDDEFDVLNLDKIKFLEE